MGHPWYLKYVSVVTMAVFIFNTICQDIAFSARPTLDPSRFEKILGDIEKVASPFSVETFQLPQYLGEVKDSWGPVAVSTEGPRSPVVIHIQDAHCNYLAQQKISEIIGFFNRSYGVRAVNLEGGAGAYDLSVLSGIDDIKLRMSIADKLVRDGEVGGAELYAVNNPEKVDLWGVEDPKLYIDNLDVYRSTVKYKDTIDRLIKNISYLLTNLKLHIYSVQLLDFDRKRAAFQNGNLDFKEYLVFLLDMASKNSVALDLYPRLTAIKRVLAIENSIDFKKAEKERDEIVSILQKDLSKTELEELVEHMVMFKFNRISREDLFKYISKMARSLGMETEKFPDFHSYTVYIATYESVDKSALLGEVKSLENDLWARISETAEQKRLFHLFDNLRLIEDLLNLKLTRDRYEYYSRHKSDFDIMNFVSFISANAPIYKISTPLDGDVISLNEYIKNMEKFYVYSFQRDDVFLENIKFDPKSRLAVLVTGGFHTENLCALMRDKGISYVSIMPKFQSPEGYESPYFRLLSGELYGVNEKIAKVLGIYVMAISSVLNTLGITLRPRDWLIDQLRIKMDIALASGNKGINIIYGDKTLYFDGRWNELTIAQAAQMGDFDAVFLSGAEKDVMQEFSQKKSADAGEEETRATTPAVTPATIAPSTGRIAISTGNRIPRGFRGQAGSSYTEILIGVFVLSVAFLAIFPYVSIFLNVSSVTLGIVAVVPITFIVFTLRSAVQQFSQYMRSPFDSRTKIDEKKRTRDAAAEEWLRSMKRRPYTNAKIMGGNALNEDELTVQFHVLRQIENKDRDFEANKGTSAWSPDGIKNSVRTVIEQLYPDESNRPAEVRDFQYALESFSVELHRINTGTMGIPKHEGAAFVIDQVPIHADYDPDTSTINIYATDVLIDRIDNLRAGTDVDRSFADRLVAEIVDHEYAENILKNTHAEAARRAKLYGVPSINNGLSPYHTLILDKMAEEGDLVSLLYFDREPLRALRRERDARYETDVFKRYIRDNALRKAYIKFYDRVFLSPAGVDNIVNGILRDIQNLKDRSTYRNNSVYWDEIDRYILKTMVDHLDDRIGYLRTNGLQITEEDRKVTLRQDQIVDLLPAEIERMRKWQKNSKQAEEVLARLVIRQMQRNMFEEEVLGFVESAKNSVERFLDDIRFNLNLTPLEKSQLATVAGFFIGAVGAFASLAFDRLDFLPLVLIPAFIIPIIGFLSTQSVKGAAEFFEVIIELLKGFAVEAYTTVVEGGKRVYYADPRQALDDIANFYRDYLGNLSLRQMGFSREIALLFAALIGFCQFITHNFDPVVLVGISTIAGFLIPVLQLRTGSVLNWFMQRIEDAVKLQNETEKQRGKNEDIEKMIQTKMKIREEQNRIKTAGYREIYQEMSTLWEEMRGLVAMIGREKAGVDSAIQDRYLRPGADRLGGHLIKWSLMRKLCADLSTLITEQNNRDPGGLATALRSLDTDKGKIKIAHIPGAIRFQYSQLMSQVRSDITFDTINKDEVDPVELEQLQYDAIIKLLETIGNNADKAIDSIETYLGSEEVRAGEGGTNIRQIEKEKAEGRVGQQKTLEERTEEIIGSLQNALSLARFPEQQIIIYMPIPANAALQNPTIQNERSVRTRLDKEYGMGKVRVRFLDAADPTDLMAKLDQINSAIRTDPSLAIMVYVPESQYDLVMTWARARDQISTAIEDNNAVFIKEAFGENEFSKTMVGVHAAIAISVFAMLRNASVDYKKGIADNFITLLTNVGADEAAGAFKDALDNEKLEDALKALIKGKILLEIKPLSEELSEQLEAIEAIAKSL